MKRKNKIVFIAITLTTLLTLFVYEKYFFNKTIIYPDFGISIPAGYNTHGIDVSRYQHKINWEDVSNMRDQGQRISFAIAKCTEGSTIIDPFFKKNWKKIKENNLLRGSYLYFHPNRKPKEQAEFFIKHADLTTGDLPPVIDIEEAHGLSNGKIREALMICIETLEKKYNTKPIIYTGADFYKNKLGESFDEYPLWVAHYEQAVAPHISRKWIIWQHNCKGRVNGIRGDVDFNVFNGSLSALRSLCL
jgi:lysozyme